MLLMTLFSTYFCYFFHESVPQLYYYLVIYFLTFSPSFPLFSGNVTLTLFVENKRNILWKKILSTFFSKFQFFDHFPNISLSTFFLKCIMKKLNFFFSTQHQNSSVPPPSPVCVLDFIFNALPFFPQHWTSNFISNFFSFWEKSSKVVNKSLKFNFEEKKAKHWKNS